MTGIILIKKLLFLNQSLRTTVGIKKPYLVHTFCPLENLIHCSIKLNALLLARTPQTWASSREYCIQIRWMHSKILLCVYAKPSIRWLAFIMLISCIFRKIMLRFKFIKLFRLLAYSRWVFLRHPNTTADKLCFIVAFDVTLISKGEGSGWRDAFSRNITVLLKLNGCLFRNNEIKWLLFHHLTRAKSEYFRFVFVFWTCSLMDQTAWLESVFSEWASNCSGFSVISFVYEGRGQSSSQFAPCQTPRIPSSGILPSGFNLIALSFQKWKIS